MLQIKNLFAGYGDLKVLYDVSFYVDQGEVVSLVGANGAGKTTLLRVISGLVPITSGSVTFEDRDLLKEKAYARAEIGIAQIPQGRGILGTLSVKDNLLVGAFHKSAQPSMQKNMELAYEMFPILKARQNQVAGSLSGGQQQMLAIARALMMEPKLLMLDEPSLGLAPILVDEMFETISNVAKRGMSILIVEQNLIKALGVADRGYVLETGHVTMEGSAKELLNNENVKSAYLGL
jgi:branched-chain amino acid transport system ATP-binding protein